LVGLFDDPYIASDLHNFDANFHPPGPPSFTKSIHLTTGESSIPTAIGDQALETALDVEWARQFLCSGRAAVSVIGGRLANELNSGKDDEVFAGKPPK